MRDSLAQWISDADALRHLEHFRSRQIPLSLSPLRARAEDYYLSLVGELFDRMRNEYSDKTDWATLGNALVQFAERDTDSLARAGVHRGEARLFASAAFYNGGYPASAHLTMRPATVVDNTDAYRSCFDFLARPSFLASDIVRSLIDAVGRGDPASIDQIVTAIADRVIVSLAEGPNEWIPERLLQVLVARFRMTNLRAVLPDGNSQFWTPLVSSFLSQRPPAWEFFPSQIHAISQGLLNRTETFSLQMPTGAGKTALCETLLFHHLMSDQDNLAVLLVPYRSLASELRATLVKRLNKMGILARTAYGGTVPVGNESGMLDAVQALVATPESLSGLLSANPSFFHRITLVVVDEGHLLDGGARGISLELLLARMKTRDPVSPRFVFISAIVPNIEEINSWLGGTADTVVRSDYRPAIAEFALLRPDGTGSATSVVLEMHPHKPEPTRYPIERFLSQEDFKWTNPKTGKANTFKFTSVKTQAIAAARKTLPMGASAVFAANKGGKQGAIGLAEELLSQLDHRLLLPEPKDYSELVPMEVAWSYASEEYGVQWIGARMLAVGAVLHHGDIPQETREVIENLLRKSFSKLAICTSTLAEGVNLPIRTLVLYSVIRRDKTGAATALLARDIKNLVGRAGRAGATTKGLVICANDNQWTSIQPVAEQALGENVEGALRELIRQIRSFLARTQEALTNELLERFIDLHSLVDGVDATLIELAAQEIGEDALLQLAIAIADRTFASTQSEAESKRILQEVFQLRTRRVIELRSSGRLIWIRETGAKTRVVDQVENGLLPRRTTWSDITNPTDPALVAALVDWGCSLAEVQGALREAYQIDDKVDAGTLQMPFQSLVNLWLSGRRFVEIADQLHLPVDDVLRIHARVLSYSFQTIVEQGMAVLSKILESRGMILAPAAILFPELLRFGVPTPTACILAAEGVRHRRATVALGTLPEVIAVGLESRPLVCSTARQILISQENVWRPRLGELIYSNTLQDLNDITSNS